MFGRIARPKPLLALAGASAFAGFYVYDPVFERRVLAGVRSSRTALCAASIVALKYRPQIVDQSAEEFQIAKSACHQRSANKLLSLFNTNGGIYVKLGQHIAALVYLLPIEYTETMKAMQDQCTPTSLEDIKGLLLNDLGLSMEDVFESFDPVPIGVASLAQVHTAVLKGTTETVAVKVQHPSLDVYSKVDIQMCADTVRLVKQAFPEFEFDWLAEEMQSSLPDELDFLREADNGIKTFLNFEKELSITIPRIYWATRRILVMEYFKGGRIDDLAYMKEHGINPFKVSAVLTKLYSQMIYNHGFVHCDPHPGNILVKPFTPKNRFLSYFYSTNPNNFEVVLLDHGLYRQLTSRFRVDYANLWLALIKADEAAIETACFKLFAQNPRLTPTSNVHGVKYHKLFASMLTGRSWTVISNARLATLRTNVEVDDAQSHVGKGGVLVAVSEVLAAVPRELLLLLKVNDLLRAVDEALEVGKDSQVHMIRMLSGSGWYCARAVRNDAIQAHGFLSSAYWAAEYRYATVTMRLLFLNLYAMTL